MAETDGLREELEEALLQVQQLLTRYQVQAAADRRVIFGIGALAVSLAPDPLKASERLRSLCLDDAPPPDDPFDAAVHTSIERVLSQIETWGADTTAQG